MKCAKPSYAFALAMHIKDINKTNKKQRDLTAFNMFNESALFLSVNKHDQQEN